MRLETFDRATGDFAAAPPHPRFGVYRNNVVSGLITALSVRYPVTEQLVGTEFFAAMAGSFARDHRPASPVLIAYGEEFPGFISSFDAASTVPYLADVARLESRWWRAYHAADAVPMEREALAAMAPGEWASARLMLHPSVSVMASPFAVASIWEAHHGGAALRDIVIDAAEFVLVTRPFALVEIRRIGGETHDLLRDLLSGVRLGAAAGGLADFDLASNAIALIGLNIITGLAA